MRDRADLQVLEDCTASLITERRAAQPWALGGGEAGAAIRGAVLRTDRALGRLARFLGNGSLPPDKLFAVLRSVFLDFRPAGFVPRRLTDGVGKGTAP